MVSEFAMTCDGILPTPEVVYPDRLMEAEALHEYELPVTFDCRIRGAVGLFEHTSSRKGLFVI